jgi:hypothetical protein
MGLDIWTPQKLLFGLVTCNLQGEVESGQKLMYNIFGFVCDI